MRGMQLEFMVAQ